MWRTTGISCAHASWVPAYCSVFVLLSSHEWHEGTPEWRCEAALTVHGFPITAIKFHLLTHQNNWIAFDPKGQLIVKIRGARIFANICVTS